MAHDMDVQELDQAESGTTDHSGGRRPRIRFGAAVAVAAGAGLAAWAIVGSSAAGSSATDSPPPPAVPVTTPKAIGPVALSAQALRKFTSAADQPVYWAGPRAGYRYELSRTKAGTVFVRYLPPGVQAGSKRQIYLIVATYPFANPLQALKNLSGAHIAIPGGGVAMVDVNKPQSVHLAYPGVNDQLEVYDPSPQQSLKVARSGGVRPVSS
jgi:hypothetical protein